MLWRRHRRRANQSGQALVEFAIVAPLIVMILLFAIWFYELIFVRLKAQEAARYAAWEATSYQLHDYARGPVALSPLASTMQLSVMADTMARYSDLNSANNSITSIGLSHGLLAAEWKQPVVLVTNNSEEQVPGGAVVNLIVSIAGNLLDWLSALNYKNANPIATTLIAAGKAGQGKALTSRMFGNSAWGFNRRGYAEARIGIMVKNCFFDRGVGRFLVSHKASSFMVWEKHGVLADSWRLDDGSDVYGGEQQPGNVPQKAFWKQVDRMYMMNQAAKSAAKVEMSALYLAGVTALGASLSVVNPEFSVADMTRAAVVSKGYSGTSAMTAGRARIRQDRPSSSEDYDTAPVGKLGNTNEYGDELKEYGKSLEARGNYFMGCKTVMSLGCPSSSLSQDNPFGGYLVRE